MGKLIVERRYIGWIENRRVELTHEDYELRKKRKEERQEGELRPALFPWHSAFVKRLDKCPYCGETPYICAGWRENRGYSYKIVCRNDCHLINCGDWYGQLSRAGLSWNYRVLEASGGPHKICPHLRRE